MGLGQRRGTAGASPAAATASVSSPAAAVVFLDDAAAHAARTAIPAARYYDAAARATSTDGQADAATGDREPHAPRGGLFRADASVSELLCSAQPARSAEPVQPLLTSCILSRTFETTFKRAVSMLDAL